MIGLALRPGAQAHHLVEKLQWQGPQLGAEVGGVISSVICTWYARNFPLSVTGGGGFQATKISVELML